MKFLNVKSDVKGLSFEKQRMFELFYADSMNKKLRPITLDFTLAIVLIDALANIVGQYNSSIGWSSVHALGYLYLISIIFLALVNKFTTIRYKAPFMVYALMTILMVFAYRDFVIESGWLEPVMGLFFFLAFIGYITASLKHSVIILLINAVVLSLCHSFMYGSAEGMVKASSLLSSAFVFNCTLSALTAAVFVNWIFKNLLAMQFLLNEKNDSLVSTLKMLKVTETQLIQQQKFQALNHMAKGLLHEIINPVNSASQALSYAKSINQDEDIGEAIEEAMLQQKRISDIVTDLRRFAQPELNQQLESQPLDELISKAIKFCHRELKKSNVVLNISIGDQQCIVCQPSALIQVFVNLIINACDALKHKADGQIRSIEISSYEDGDNLVIYFKDNGLGITEFALQQIMDPFFSSNPSSKNMGLGLSICQTIMRHHSGSLHIKSEINKWTEVALTLPAHIRVNQAKALKQTLGKENHPNTAIKLKESEN